MTRENIYNYYMYAMTGYKQRSIDNMVALYISDYFQNF